MVFKENSGIWIKQICIVFIVLNYIDIILEQIFFLRMFVSIYINELKIISDNENLMTVIQSSHYLTIYELPFR